MSETMTCAEGKQDDWAKWVESAQDDYGHQCVMVAVVVGEALDEGLSPKDAADKMYGYGLTGFMAGAVAKMVSQCHVRGDEFRRWWNVKTQINKEGEKANEKGGVLNPAILTAKEGE